MIRTETFEITLTSREIENEIWGLDSVQQVDLILAMAQRYKNDQHHVLMQLTNIADDFKEMLTDEERRYALRLLEDIITYLKVTSESMLAEYKMREEVRRENPYEDNTDKSSLVHGIMNNADSVDDIDVVKLTDTEQRIFLAAMSRELKICREENRNPGDVDLVAVCNSIERKVKNTLF